MRPFRFGFQFQGGSPTELVAEAVNAEAAGFDVFSSSDHVDTGWPPLPPLLAAALATTTLRVCPLVINNDLRHPVELARDVLAIDQLTGGRFELGIGAGHSAPEYAAVGVDFDPGPVRKARLRESVEILRSLLAGQTTSFNGEYYQLDGVQLQQPHGTPIPLLVAASGPRARAHSAQFADIVGLTGLGRTLPDGQKHTVNWQPERLDAEVAVLRAHAAGPPPELNALVQVVTVTSDRHDTLQPIVDRVEGLDLAAARQTPFLAVGTHDEIAANMVAARDRWGISYFTVRDIDAFAPVIERLRAIDEASTR